MTIEQHLPPDDVLFATEATLPKTMADHNHRVRARRKVVFRSDHPSPLGADSKNLEVIAGNHSSVHQITLIITVEARGNSAPGDEPIKDMILIAHFGVIRVRENAARIAIENVNQILRMRDGQRSHQRSIDGTKNCAVYTHAQRQSHCRNGGERAVFEQAANSKANVLN